MNASPEQYSPEFCETIRLSCATHMTALDKAVEKNDGRLWNIMVLAIINLLATVGGLGTLLVQHLLGG